MSPVARNHVLGRAARLSADTSAVRLSISIAVQSRVLSMTAAAAASRSSEPLRRLHPPRRCPTHQAIPSSSSSSSSSTKSSRGTHARRRSFSSTASLPASETGSSLPAAELLHMDNYHRLADAFLEALLSKLEELQESRTDVDVEYNSGVLTLQLPPHGTYVLNKQPPNKQIWLSSPVSGPKRYDWVSNDEGAVEGTGGWIYLRDGSSLTDLIKDEMGVELGDWET